VTRRRLRRPNAAARQGLDPPLTALPSVQRGKAPAKSSALPLAWQEACASRKLGPMPHRGCTRNLANSHAEACELARRSLRTHTQKHANSHAEARELARRSTRTRTQKPANSHAEACDSHAEACELTRRSLRTHTQKPANLRAQVGLICRSRLNWRFPPTGVSRQAELGNLLFAVGGLHCDVPQPLCVAEHKCSNAWMVRFGCLLSQSSERAVHESKSA
jgi:hypothetical protein